MKNGEIAWVVGLVISVETLALAFYDLGFFKNVILLFEFSTIDLFLNC